MIGASHANCGGVTGFPFSVFGWPENKEDLEASYPTSLLETGNDILSFWVASMAMMALGLTDKLPFNTVFFSCPRE